MRIWQKTAIAMLALLVGQTTLAQGPALVTKVSAQVAQEPASAATNPATGAAAALTRADLEAWLDGFMPFALARSDIAGGVVVVVKDGQVLLQKGYGLADVARRTKVSPEATLFRPGSVSKLLTWTAVMQLVEEGKLDLDKDVNTYLDFKIPDYAGKPITLRNVLTHTTGFEESARYTITSKPMELGPLVKNTVPRRIFAPGITPAYSNYATALAGHIVARASGMSFDDYVEARIFRPLGMNRSSFRQPLPKALEPMMSKSYDLASGKATSFEFVGPAPAGSLSSTGADMAKFMIAHLDNGRGLLRPETARIMHDTKLDVLPPLNRMALGFYESNLNGRRVIAHGGDTQYFHSNLALFQDEKVGLYISVNSGGKDGATRPLRNALLQQFADRYFPAPRDDRRVDAATAKQHAQMFVGTYANSRGFKTNFLSILNLIEPTTIGLTADGMLSGDALAGMASQPRQWVEIAPFVWRDVDSGQRIAAKVENGKVVRWSFDEISPFMMFDRVPWYLDGAWLAPALMLGLGVILLTALSWPVGAINRRRYGAAVPDKDRRLAVTRSTNALAWLALATLAGWAAYVMVGLSGLNFAQFDWLLWTVQILSPIAFVGLAGFAAWSMWLTWQEKRGWFARLWSILLVLASLILLWVALGFHLIGFGTKF